MKQVLLASALCILAFASCKKDDGDPMTLPQISFKNTTGYTYKDTTVAKGTALLTGINAAKSEPFDVLKRFTINQGFEADTLGTTVYQEDLTGALGDSYSHDYTIQTRNIAGKEHYVYTVINRDGLINQVKLTITTQ